VSNAARAILRTRPAPDLLFTSLPGVDSPSRTAHGLPTVRRSVTDPCGQRSAGRLLLSGLSPRVLASSPEAQRFTPASHNAGTAHWRVFSHRSTPKRVPSSHQSHAAPSSRQSHDAPSSHESHAASSGHESHDAPSSRQSPPAVGVVGHEQHQRVPTGTGLSPNAGFELRRCGCLSIHKDHHTTHQVVSECVSVEHRGRRR
jgi:hypothetical protein